MRQLSMIVTLVTLVTGLASVAASRSHAAQPCGGIKVGDGALSLGDRLSLDRVAQPDGEACIKAIATELMKREGLQGITIAARVPNDEGMRKKGEEAARLMADKLAAAGLRRSLISTVVPTARPDEKDALYVAFVEQRSTRSVAQVQALSGRVTAGHQLGSLRDASVGQLLTGSDFIETGKGSRAHLKLLDGSHVWLFEGSIMRFGQVALDEYGQRSVKINMLKGEAAVVASEREGPFYLVTGSAIAGVRGTDFRMVSVDTQKSRVETLSGTVTFGGKNANLFVPRGKGSRVDHKGVPEDPRPLLVAADIEYPLFGRARLAELMRWKPVGEARGYRVELAENAQFTRGWRVYETTANRMPVPDGLPEGKWFWRVTPVDVDGFLGYPSKIYAFTYSER